MQKLIKQEGKSKKVECHVLDGATVMTVKQVLTQTRWNEPALRARIRKGDIEVIRIGPKFLFIIADQDLIVSRFLVEE